MTTLTPKQAQARVKQAAEHIEQAANALKPLEDAGYVVADMRGGWLDDARALARLYGRIGEDA